MVESLPYNEKVDVYAFGLLLWEMLEGRRVFDGMGVTDFYERVVNAGARPNLDPSWPQARIEIINRKYHTNEIYMEYSSKISLSRGKNAVLPLLSVSRFLSFSLPT